MWVWEGGPETRLRIRGYIPRMGHGDITRVVNGLGAEVEREALSREIYEQLRVCVRSVLAGENPAGTGVHAGQDLTLVVHECWLKLQGTPSWDSRAHYFGAASRATRQILIDMARKRKRTPHGLSYHEGSEPPDRDQVMDPDLSDALDRVGTALEGLEAIAPRAARVASFRLFGNLSPQLIAQEEGVSVRTIERDWEFARPWLASRLSVRIVNNATARFLSQPDRSDA